MTLEECEKLSTAHHKHCYNREKFDWEWQTVHCLGVWAFGGNKVTPSSNFLVEILVPKSSDEQVEGWYCYIGPIPKFSTN